MSGDLSKARLFVEQDLARDAVIELDAKRGHYVRNVMRMRPEECLTLFNGRDGEWSGRVEPSPARRSVIRCGTRIHPQVEPPDIWLVFAPLKRSRTDFLVEKATEIGVSKIIPVFTEFTNTGRVHRARLASVAIEASEQCGSITVPQIAEVGRLTDLLAEWDMARHIVMCDESLAGQSRQSASPDPTIGHAVFVGPEGGFSPDERALFATLENCTRQSLGERILRAETAATAALALLHAALASRREDAA